VQISHRGINKTTTAEVALAEERKQKDNRTKQSRTMRVLNTDSYEIDWATDRKLPIKEYLELEDQPDIKTGKTIAEVITKNRTIE
jgi:hypothetical protein